MEININNRKKRLSLEEYNNLNADEKKKFKEMIYDEEMSPGDDIDVSYRCIRAELRFAMVPFWVQHHRFTDHEDADSQAKQKRMGEYFKKKWNLK
jgi:hypothetical protein